MNNVKNFIVPEGEKITPEKEFRRKLINYARALDGEMELRQIFDKYDRLLKSAKNSDEHNAIAAFGIQEIHKFFQCRSALIVNGEMILTGEAVQLEPEFKL